MKDARYCIHSVHDLLRIDRISGFMTAIFQSTVEPLI